MRRILFSLAFLLWCFLAPASWAGIAPDQSGTGQSSGGTTTPITVTASANTTIIIGCVVGSTSTTTLPALSISGAGLTWTLVGTNGGAAFFNSRYYALTVWTARTSGSVSAQTVTVSSTQTIDNAATIFASYTGVISPYIDPNGALPIQVFNTNNVKAAEEPYTTSKPGLMFAFIGSNQNSLQWLNPATPPNSSVVQTVQNSGGTYWAYLGLMTVPISGPQSGTTYGSTYATTSNWVFIGSSLVGPGSRARMIVIN